MIEQKKQRLKDRINELNEELDALYEQLGGVPKHERILLNRQIKVLEQEQEQADAELKRLEATSESSNRAHLLLRQNLCKIDFHQPSNTVKQIMQGFGRHGGAALFLLQNNIAMQATLFAERLRTILLEEGRLEKPIELTATPDMPLDEDGLLHQLAGCLNVQGDSSTPHASIPRDQHKQQVIETLCGMVRNQNVILIQITGWDYFGPQDRLLHWFVNDFWASLVAKLPELSCDYRRLRFVAVMIADDKIPAEYLEPYCCCTDSFEQHRVLELNLDHWSKDDIQDWLERYTTLQAAQIDSVARTIYRGSMNGVPSMVTNYLLQQFGQ